MSTMAVVVGALADALSAGGGEAAASSAGSDGSGPSAPTKQATRRPPAISTSGGTSVSARSGRIGQRGA